MNDDIIPTDPQPDRLYDLAREYINAAGHVTFANLLLHINQQHMDCNKDDLVLVLSRLCVAGHARYAPYWVGGHYVQGWERTR